MSEKFIDLHVHTNFSDGFDTIEEVIAKAKANNVGVIALAEHYNMSSYDIACNLAGDYDIEVIPAIEIGTDMSEYSKNGKHVCHILGYFVSKKIYRLLDAYEIDRYSCVVKTLELLNKHGVQITMNDVLENARDKKSVGRFDVAKALKALGYAKTASEAYGKYLDHSGVSYVKRQKLTPEELIKKITECDGIAVLAHPKSLRFDKEQEARFIEKLVQAGLSGIEVYNPNNNDQKREELLSYCDKYSLIPTCGSDYHGGKRKPKIEIGLGIEENLKISDYTIVERLKQKACERDCNHSKRLKKC